MVSAYSFSYVLLLLVGDLTGFVTSQLTLSGQSDSFVVSANYGVQSSSTVNSTKSIKNEVLPTPSSWKVSNHQSSHPQIFINSSPEVIYGNPSKNWTQLETVSQDRKDNNFQPAPRYDVNDIHKPSVEDLQQMISKILKGSTKVHQVVKVPAVYEIHLQEEEKPASSSWNSLQEWKPQTPVKTWTKPPSYTHPVKNKKIFYRNGRHTTKTWNLPSKIQYFGKSTRYGKYPYPRPFTSTKTWKSPVTQSINAIPLDTWNSYSSVNVPMTPGSTSVSFLDYSGQREHESHPGVDLSLYYAKKKELENQGYGVGNFHRRSSKGERRRNVRQERLFPGLPPGLNYVIHVREKSS